MISYNQSTNFINLFHQIHSSKIGIFSIKLMLELNEMLKCMLIYFHQHRMVGVKRCKLQWPTLRDLQLPLNQLTCSVATSIRWGSWTSLRVVKRWENGYWMMYLSEQCILYHGVSLRAVYFMYPAKQRIPQSDYPSEQCISQHELSLRVTYPSAQTIAQQYISQSGVNSRTNSPQGKYTLARTISQQYIPQSGVSHSTSYSSERHILQHGVSLRVVYRSEQHIPQRNGSLSSMPGCVDACAPNYIIVVEDKNSE